MSNTIERYNAALDARDKHAEALEQALLQINPNTANLVLRFATALAEKLSASERKYGFTDTWADDHWMEQCQRDLINHVAKGDPRDVAAYCAFMWHHGWPTTLNTGE